MGKHRSECKNKRGKCDGECRIRHNKAQARYRIKLQKLGYPSGIRNPITYLKELNKHAAWNKAHKARIRELQVKWRDKLREEGGTLNDHDLELVRIKRWERKYAKRIATQNNKE